MDLSEKRTGIPSIEELGDFLKYLKTRIFI